MNTTMVKSVIWFLMFFDNKYERKTQVISSFCYINAHIRQINEFWAFKINNKNYFIGKIYMRTYTHTRSINNIFIIAAQEQKLEDFWHMWVWIFSWSCVMFVLYHM